MKKQFFGKILVIIAMACLTFIFAALSIHFDVFAPSFNDDPIDWGIVIVLLFVFFCVGVIGIIICCLLGPIGSFVLVMPIEVWNDISKRHGKWQHLINVFLLALCVAFIVYAVNLVSILEYLSGEHYKSMPTFSGFLAVLYAWVVTFGTIILYCWLSGLIEAVRSFFKELARIEGLHKKN